MMLRSLELNNIRSYINQKIEFPETGITLLAGDIGSGKSTVLLSIEFALFGLRGQEVAGSSLLRHGTNSGYVVLAFEVQGKHVEIKRVLERKNKTISQTSGYISVDGVREELTTLSLKSQVLDLIGYPEKILKKSKSLLYRYTVYTPQEQMKEILFSSPEERLNTIRDIFSVDKYKRIAENARIGARELRVKIRETQAQIQDLEIKRADLQKILDEQREILLRIQEKKHLYAEQETKYKQLLEKSKDLLEKMERIKKLEHESELIDSKIQSNAKLMEDMSKELDRLYARLKGLEGSMTNADAQIHRMQRELVSAQEEQKRLLLSKQKLEGELQRYNEMQKKLAEFSALLMAREEQINILHREIKADEGSITLVQTEQSPEAKLESLKKQLAMLPKLKETKDVLEKQVKIIEQENTAIETKITEAVEKVQHIMKLDDCPTCLQKVPKNYRDRIAFNEEERVKKLGDQHKKNQYALNESKQQLATVVKEIEQYLEKEKEAIVLKNALQQIVQMREAVQEKRARKEAMEKQLVALTRQRDSLKVEADALELVNKRAKEADERLHQLNTVLVATTKQLSEFIKDKEEFERATKEQLDKFRRTEELRKENEMLTKKKEFVLGQLELMKEVHAVCKEVQAMQDKAMEELQNTKEQIVKQEQMLEHAQKSQESAQKEIGEKERKKLQALRLQEINAWIEDRFIPTVDLIERHILAKIMQDFNELFQHWFKMLIEDESLSARIDSRFTPFVEQNGYETSFENLSGGEKTSLALAYRLALNKTINALSEVIKTKDLLILDEPTDGFSAEQLDKLRDVLDDLKLKQIILVSHEDKIEGFVDTTIRFKKDGHVSTISAKM